MRPTTKSRSWLMVAFFPISASTHSRLCLPCFSQQAVFAVISQLEDIAIGVEALYESESVIELSSRSGAVINRKLVPEERHQSLNNEAHQEEVEDVIEPSNVSPHKDPFIMDYLESQKWNKV